MRLEQCWHKSTLTGEENVISLLLGVSSCLLQRKVKPFSLLTSEEKGDLVIILLEGGRKTSGSIFWVFDIEQLEIKGKK